MEAREISETELIPITADFSEGDRVWLETSPGHVFFGTIRESNPDRMRIMMDFNNEVVFTDTTSPTLERSLENMGKIIDTPKLTKGDILSRINRKDGKTVREYAEVVEIIPFEKISLKFFDEIDEYPLEYHSYRTSLEERLIRWELEG